MPSFPDWGDPTEEMIAAFALAQQRRRGKYLKGFTEWEIAEFILMGPESFMYAQAKDWAENPPPVVEEGAKEFFRLGAAFAKRVIDLGYDAEHKTWWYMPSIPKEEVRVGLIYLMDLGGMLRQMRQSTLHVAAGSWTMFLEIICGAGWEKRYEKWLADVKTSFAAEAPAAEV